METRTIKYRLKSIAVRHMAAIVAQRLILLEGRLQTAL